MRGHFRYSVWDPLLLISQIITIQCIFYVSLALWILFADTLSLYPLSLDQVFLYKTISVTHLNGRCLAGAFLINSLVCSVALWYFVQRTKLCLDFTVTAHGIHLLACWFYSGAFPCTAAWWVLQVMCITVMCVCGEFMCMRSEMKCIPLSMANKADL